MTYITKGTTEIMIKIGSHVSNNGLKMMIGSVEETIENNANCMNKKLIKKPYLLDIQELEDNSLQKRSRRCEWNCHYKKNECL